jgi:hypothetical protein
MAKRMINFACDRCKKNVVVEVPDEAIPISHPNVVGFLYPTLPRGKCLECGMVYIPQIAQVQPVWIWIACEEQTESGLVLANAPLPKTPFNRM